MQANKTTLIIFQLAAIDTFCAQCGTAHIGKTKLYFNLFQLSPIAQTDKRLLDEQRKKEQFEASSMRSVRN